MRKRQAFSKVFIKYSFIHIIYIYIYTYKTTLYLMVNPGKCNETTRRENTGMSFAYKKKSRLLTNQFV